MRSELKCGDAKAAALAAADRRPDRPRWNHRPAGAHRFGRSRGGAARRRDRIDRSSVRALVLGVWRNRFGSRSPPARSPGAKAAVVITNGPTGKIIALNADGRAPMFGGPVALLAPENAKPFLAAAMRRAPATLIVHGNGGGSVRRSTLSVASIAARTALAGGLDAAIRLVCLCRRAGAGVLPRGCGWLAGQPGDLESQPRFRLQHGS